MRTLRSWPPSSCEGGYPLFTDSWVPWGIPVAEDLGVTWLAFFANKQGYDPGVSGLHCPACRGPLTGPRGGLEVHKR